MLLEDGVWQQQGGQRARRPGVEGGAWITPAGKAELPQARRSPGQPLQGSRGPQAAAPRFTCAGRNPGVPATRAERTRQSFEHTVQRAHDAF